MFDNSAKISFFLATKNVNLQIYQKNMFRIILVISLILLAMPFLGKIKDYVSEKSHNLKTAQEVAKKMIKYK
jgi:hypothetical protein